MNDPSDVFTAGALLSINVSDLGGTTYVTPRGEVDLSNSDAVWEALTSTLDSEGQRVVLNLSEVSFIDSSGIAVLLKAEAAARSKGRSLAMANPSRMVETVLEIAGLWERLPIVSTRTTGQSAPAGT